MSLKTGDVVKLNSGGPAMTVGRCGPFERDGFEPLTEGECNCAWFGADGRPNIGAFHVDMLSKLSGEACSG